MATNVQAEDRVIARDRTSRVVVFFGTPFVTTIVGALLTGSLIETFLGEGPFFSIGAVIGAVAGFVGFLSIKHLFFVQNDTTGLLVTLDRLRSLLGLPDVNVVYGPGTFISFPWEKRIAENNIPIKETSEEFTFPVICTDGTLTVSASFRLRPDFENPINYLSGVGAVAGDMKDLVISFITDKLVKKTMQVAINEKEIFNKALHDEFVNGSVKTPFELRFGVRVGDVTVSNLLMSDETQRTRSGLNEATVVSQGTAILLGFQTVAEMQAAVGTTIQQADVERARREFRIISGNMDGSEVKRFEVDITGLTPEVAAAVTAFLNNPAARSLFTGGKGSKPQTTKGTP